MASKGRWLVDSGILRKKIDEDEPQELLVFGYSCKLFRDDEKAKLIDQGKHLIPWMSDNTLKIDRYDGRGALGDLRIHEPPPGGYDYRTILTEDEYKIEQACDEERYKSLYNNDAEDFMYHEEEIKRLHQALDAENTYSQVAYSYENDNKKIGEDSQSPKTSEVSQEDDQAFIPDPRLEIPDDMVVPETQKLNAVIAKTALFISRQGTQMEILIRTKQSNNPQFSFLSIDGELHPYYKLLLEAIKSGKINPEEQQSEKEEPEQEEESDDDDDCYLHPSLATSLAKVEAAPSIPSISYKPSADCAYSMLVNKITGKPPVQKIQQPQPPPEPFPPPMPNFFPPMQNFQQYPLPPQQYSHGPVMYSSNGTILQPHEAQTYQPVLKQEMGNNVQTPQKEITPLVPYGPTPPKPLTRPSFIVPPAEVQIIIDKMASYVAKNGRDFESIVKSKGDPRFNFLELSHQYHGYYAHKLTIYEGDVNPKVITEEELLQKQELQEEKRKKLEEMQKKQQRMEEVQKRVKMIQAKKKEEIDSKQNENKQVTPVSFSIKKPKEGDSGSIEKINTFPQEESDEDSSSDDKREIYSKYNLIPEDAEDSYPKPESTYVYLNDTKIKNDSKIDSPKPAKAPCDNNIVDLTDDLNNDDGNDVHYLPDPDELEENFNKFKKEKINSSREKQLQLERRLRAAKFLSQISSSHSKTNVSKSNSKLIKAQKEEIQINLTLSPTRKEYEREDSRSNSSLMNRLRGAELDRKRSRQRSRSRSRSTSYSDRHRSHKKHKHKHKSSHKSSYRSSRSSSKSHNTKKPKKSSRHSSRSRSPSYKPYRRSRESTSSESSSYSS